MEDSRKAWLRRHFPSVGFVAAAALAGGALAGIVVDITDNRVHARLRTGLSNHRRYRPGTPPTMNIHGKPRNNNPSSLDLAKRQRRAQRRWLANRQSDP